MGSPVDGVTSKRTNVANSAVILSVALATLINRRRALVRASARLAPVHYTCHVLVVNETLDAAPRAVIQVSIEHRTLRTDVTFTTMVRDLKGNAV